ncbi:lipid A ethanolaminephosphotransferase [Comamonas sp. BIGb0124]|uniref:phosphoethanolamine transferase n=1 Tax=Comamonas sp. BIGb0124 TaxID=2485130 RepID=UPI000F4A1D66|nr:phosphoethanolamine--lipid A transferase [Comamonas sp. BIGb0124]ROR17043.1 lipid A ethanolaminephosphotransferase [Comamonas sp. BIGb0124]
MIKTSALSSIAAGAPSARDGVSLQLPSRASLLRRLRAGAVHQWQRPRRAQSVVLILAAWLVLTANWPLWLMLGHLDGYSGSTSWLAAIFGPLAFAGLTLLLSFSAWPRGMKAVWMLVMVLAAAGQYFMLGYGTVIDKSMVLNVFQTDLHESADLFNPRLIAELLLVAGVPGLWLAQVPVVRDGVWRNLARTLGLMLASLAVMAAVVLPSYRELAPLVRNNMSLRFMLNPANSVLAVLDAKVKPLFKHPKPFVSITAGAALGPSYVQAASAAGAGKTPLFVLVVGETGRGDHYALNGYGRDTNPELARLPVLSWHQARSCGTNTLASVPCMFSHLGKSGFESRSADYDNLLDVLQAAGLGVIWVDNQAGCKGVCERVPNFSTADRAETPAGRTLCSEGECLDEILLDGLDERIAQLPSEQRRHGVVVVLHEMGSHGPAYFRRSSPETKAFKPECTTNALADCAHEQLVNVYDNSIRYNDHVLARTIAWLQQHEGQHDVGMLYLSDHGESLGEYGIYLHGLPYAMAPEEQKHIAFIDWPGTLAARTHVDAACLGRTLDAPVTHDNLYHTVLGLMDVRSPTYRPALDAFGACRKAA